MALRYPVTKQPGIGFQILQAGSKLGNVAQQAGQMFGFNGTPAGAAGNALGLIGNAGGGNPMGAASNALGLAQNLGSMGVPGLESVGSFAGPAGLLLGGANAAMTGNFAPFAANALVSPATWGTLGAALGPEAFGGALAAGGAAGGAGAAAGAGSAGAAMGAGLAGGLASLPLLLGGISSGIDSMIKANNLKIAAKRNASRSGEAGGLMRTLMDAVRSGNLNVEVQPGVRAGDLLQALASAAAGGQLAAGKDIYEEGVMPKGQYETLARHLAAQGFSGGMNLINNQGKGNVNNLTELIGALDDAGPRTAKSGTSYGQFTDWLDQLTEGFQPAFGPQEAFVRSALWQDTPTGGAALLGTRRNELLRQMYPDMPVPGDKGFVALGGPAPDQQTVLSSYLNDPEKISVTPQGLRNQLVQSAQAYGVPIPNFDQMMMERDQRLGLGQFTRLETGGG